MRPPEIRSTPATIFARSAGLRYDWQVAVGGTESRAPLTYPVYLPARRAMGKPMAEQFRIAICLWHSFNWPGSDVFGVGTFDRPWLAAGVETTTAMLTKLEAAFEFIE